MDLELKDKTALVLGAGGGLGGAIARTLGQEGAKVAVADVNYDAAKNTTADITANGGNAISLAWDIADLTVIEGQIAAIEKTFGPIDILINNTGGPPPTPAAGQDPALWTKHFQSMVLSVIAITDRLRQPPVRSH